MSALITQHIDGSIITDQVSYRFKRYVLEIAMMVIVLIAGFSGENLAQIKPSMKIKLDVLPSVNVARMDVDLQSLFAEDIAHLNELVSAKTGGEDPVSLDFGFSISAYENITVLLSFTRPEMSEKNTPSSYPMRIVCGYLNDGTTYFRRSTITNKNAFQFRLRNNNLLKHSMKISDPLFVAYTFFLVSHEVGTVNNKGSIPVSTITLEFM